MSWILLLQVVILMLLTALLIVGVHAGIVDKRREDAHHRKENGL